jgi:hypothetical protein
MKFDRIYVNGCSFSCAGGLQWDIHKKLYKEKLSIDIDNHMDFAYPTLIANHFNVPVINESISGGSINRLIRKTYEYIFKNIHNLKGTLIMLEIPPMWRDELWSNKLDRTLNITSGLISAPDTDLTDISNGYGKHEFKKIYNEVMVYFDSFVNPDFEDKKSYNSLIGLLSFIKSLEIECIILDNSEFHHYLLKNNMRDIKFNFCFFENIQMHSWFRIKKLTIDDELNMKNIDGHAGIKGNTEISKTIINYINKIILDKKIII